MFDPRELVLCFFFSAQNTNLEAKLEFCQVFHFLDEGLIVRTSFLHSVSLLGVHLDELQSKVTIQLSLTRAASGILFFTSFLQGNLLRVI
jgi:hypothetical protein